MGAMGLLISSIWVLNFINIFIHPWWAQVAAGAIPSTSPALCKVRMPLNAFWTQRHRLPPEGMSADGIKRFIFTGCDFTDTDGKKICRERFWGLKPIKVNVSVLPRMLWMTITHTNVLPSGKTCGACLYSQHRQSFVLYFKPLSLCYRYRSFSLQPAFVCFHFFLD